MKKLVLLLSGILMLNIVGAQEKKVVLFPNGAPGEKTKLTEKSDATGAQVGGLNVIRMTDVGSPEITIYPANKDVASGAAMVVCPGGAYNLSLIHI